jgi:hypothetical protein
MRLSALLLPAALAACTAGADGRAGADPLGEAPPREPRETFRLGGLDAPAEQTFRREPVFVVDAAGLLYVLHADLGRVAVFDEAGGFVRWIGGGRGGGPGEFTSPVRLGLEGDTLWVRNLTPPRISRFLLDGTHVSTENVLVDAGYFTTAGIQGTTGHLAGGRAWMEPDGLVMATDGGEARATFVVGDRALGERATLFDWRAERGRLAGTSFAPLPEPPFHDVAADGSAILVVDWADEHPEELRVRVLGPDGSERRALSIPVPAVPVPAAVRDSLLAAGSAHVAGVRERAIAQGISPGNAPQVPGAAEIRERVFLPRHYPPVAEARLGVDGTIWLRRMDGLRPDAWVALDADGAPLFRARLPDGARLRRGSREAVWGTFRGELDVPYVVRWDITAPVEPNPAMGSRVNEGEKGRSS